MVTFARKVLNACPPRFGAKAGFTIMELLIAGLMISLVMVSAFSFYTSGLNLFVRAKSVDVAAIPEVVAEDLARKVNSANLADINPPNQLNLRVDYLNCSPSTPDPAGPANTTNDSWWHYRFHNGELLGLCENSSTNPTLTGAGIPAGTVVMLSNLDTTSSLPPYPPGTGSGGSGFQIVNPSGAGQGTVVYVHLNSINPVKELNTEAAWVASKG